MLNIAHKLLS